MIMRQIIAWKLNIMTLWRYVEMTKGVVMEKYMMFDSEFCFAKHITLLKHLMK